MIGKSKKYGLIIPTQNKTNLMLNHEVRSAIQSGFLELYPVKSFHEAFAIATGHPLGVKNIHDKSFQRARLDIIETKMGEHQKQDQKQSEQKYLRNGIISKPTKK